ncbi:MAG: hypothetical protein Q7N50_00015, partial [Armatimonadota bacterium]|nr:hypothetical protein [Armatimonadota bacterium]
DSYAVQRRAENRLSRKPAVVCYNTISNIPLGLCMEIIDMPREGDTLNVDDIVAAYLRGRGIKTIAKSLGVHFRRIKAILLAAGIDVRSVPSIDITRATELYMAGVGPRTIGQTLGVDPQRVYKILKNNGIPMRNISEARYAMLASLTPDDKTRLLRKGTGVISRIDRAAVVEGYLAGTSKRQLTKIFSAREDVIRSILVDSGVLRSPDEAWKLAISQRPLEQRRTLTRAGQEALRRYGHGPNWAAAQAIGFQKSCCKVGAGEYMLASWLQERGLNPVLQQAIDRYNIDIGLLPIAVELCTSSGNPFNRVLDRQKTEYLMNRGIHVLYIICSVRHFLQPRITDDIVTFLNQANADPSPIGQYRVIRGCGELAAGGRGNLDNVAFIPAPYCAFNGTGAMSYRVPW